MKIVSVFSSSVMLMVVVGCSSTDPAGFEDRRVLNAWLVNSLKSSATENGILKQRTLYPYHFVSNSVMLNDLGQADLDVLATHYRAHPGQLSVRRGYAEEDLYKARVQKVLNLLAKAGVDKKRMKVDDALPHGDGASADEVITSLVESQEDTNYFEQGESAGSSSQGGTGK